MKQRKPSILLRAIIPLLLVVAWMTISGIGGPYFGKISEVSEFDIAAFLPGSAESTKVNNELTKFRDSKTIPALLVFSAKDGSQIDAKATQIESAVKKAAESHTVPQAPSPPIVSKDKKAALVTVPLDSNNDLKKEVTGFTGALNKQPLDGLEYKVTGPAGFSRDLNTAFGGIDGVLLLVALAVVFVILLIVYRSPTLPFIVLMTSMVALSAAIFVVWNLAKQDIIQLNGQVQGILFILTIGAATDYSLLYVARYREELIHQPHPVLATKHALKGTFEPIIASGSTVIVGVLCLVISDLASNKALGPVGAIGIAMALASALTFLPAVLALTGRRAFWPFMPRYDEAMAKAAPDTLHGKLWPRIAKIVSSAPRFVWVACVALLLIGSLFAPRLKADGVAQSDLIIGKSEARDGQKILNEHFPAGSGSPVLVLAPVEKQDELVKVLQDDVSIDSVYAASKSSVSGQVPMGRTVTELKSSIRDAIATEQAKKLAEMRKGVEVQNPYAVDEVMAAIQSQLPDPAALAEQAYPFKNATPTQADGKILLQGTLKHAPDSMAAKDAIGRIRTAVHDISKDALVGGTTALQLDSNTASIHDRNLIIPIVLVAITGILMLLLRSVLAPILLLLTTILSFTATLGLSAVLFQDLLNFPGMDPSVVLYGFVFLVALGIDYNIFLMTRVREETLKTTTRKGVLKGLVVTGGVITSAGVVLAATFAALGVIPILFLIQLAFIVAFGVLMDTILVRSLLVPALIYDLGKIVWLPSKLK
jgi:RND superfamily putative drug exporter